jgi:hypothetical protein
MRRSYAHSSAPTERQPRTKRIATHAGREVRSSPSTPATPMVDQNRSFAGPDAGLSGLAGPADEASLWSGLTLPARVAIGAALESSIDLAHNYLGCEHLPLGLLDDPGTGAGRVLHGAGIESAALRRSIVSACADFAQARHTTTKAASGRLDALLRRRDTIERRLNAADL